MICDRPYHALFMCIMLIRPTPEELSGFGTPDYVIYNAGRFPANRHTSGMSSKTSVDLSIEDREVVILGTEYAGEMKKSAFTIMNYLMLQEGHPLDALFGHRRSPDGSVVDPVRTLRNRQDHPLRRPRRLLIGDDEHCWSDRGVFNIEGGCYAKSNT